MEDPREDKVLVGVVKSSSRKLVYQHEIVEIANFTTYPVLSVPPFFKGVLAVIDSCSEGNFATTLQCLQDLFYISCLVEYQIYRLVLFSVYL